MKSLLISLPCSLVVSLFVAEVTLSTLHMPENPRWLLGAVVISTFMLYERGLAELSIIGAISLFAQINAHTLGSQAVAPDVMLALLVTMILLPFAMRAMGIQVDPPRAH
ncbi:MAG: hypothetical protein ABJ308_15825 [Halieaceae bacterium]